MSGLAFQGSLFLFISWIMAREMRRHPEGGFFRPVLIGFAPIFVISVLSFAAIENMKSDELAKAKDAMVGQFAAIFEGSAGAKAFTQDELRQISEVSLKLQPAAVCVFWLALLTLAAMALRKWLAKRGQTKAAAPLSRWKAPDYLIWFLLLPGALLLFNQRRWLGELEPWIGDLSQNVVIVILTVYLFQGMMVVLEKISRMGLPKPLATVMLASALLMALVPAGHGIALGFLALGILDTWFDFRKLTPKVNDNKRSGL